MSDRMNRWGLPTEITCTCHGITFWPYGIEYAYSLGRDVPMLTARCCRPYSQIPGSISNDF